MRSLSRVSDSKKTSRRSKTDLPRACDLKLGVFPVLNTERVVYGPVPGVEGDATIHLELVEPLQQILWHLPLAA